MNKTVDRSTKAGSFCEGQAIDADSLGRPVGFPVPFPRSRDITQEVESPAPPPRHRPGVRTEASQSDTTRSLRKSSTHRKKTRWHESYHIGLQQDLNMMLQLHLENSEVTAELLRSAIKECVLFSFPMFLLCFFFSLVF